MTTKKRRDSTSLSFGVPMTEETIGLVERALFEEAPQHLDFETEIAPYVDGSIDAAGREIVESHLEDCAMCRGEIDDLVRIVKRRRIAPRTLSVAATVAVAVLGLLWWKVVDKPSIRNQPAPPRVVVQKPPRSTPAYENPEWARLVDTALLTGRLPLPDLSAIRPAGSTLRGGEDVPAAPIEPAGVVVMATRPLFRWPATDGATYVVSVFAGEEEVARSGRLREPHWTPRRDLARGTSYTWQVEITRGDSVTLLPQQPAPPAMFRVVSVQELEELSAARTRHPSDALLLAVLYARSGLAEEARAQLEPLAASNDPRLRKLLDHARQEASPRSTNAAQ